MNLAAIVAEILTGYQLPTRGFHGVVHWARVLENGLRLAEMTGANPAVVELFAVFHDSRRENDGTDPDHGRRGADLASQQRGRLFELPDAEFELLYRACEWHTEGRTHPDMTVQTCWDADRLDLGRVGIVPSPKYLCTKAAKSAKFIDWAHARSIKGFEPDFVTSHWCLPARDW
jgi:uncharacterized protein